MLALVMMLSAFSFASAESIGSSPYAISLAKAKVTTTVKGQPYYGGTYDIKNYLEVRVDGKLLREGVDYVIYNTETEGSAVKTYKLEPLIIGIGHYKGYLAKKISFSIQKIKPVIEYDGPDTYKAADLVSGNAVIGTAGTGGEAVAFKPKAFAGKKIQVTSNGDIILMQGLKAGKYKVTLNTLADGTHAASKQTITIQVVKAEQTITSPEQTQYEMSSPTTAQTIEISGVAASDNGALVWKSSNKKIKVKNGVVTLPAGLKSGIYVVSVYGKATATKHETTAINITFTIK